MNKRVFGRKLSRSRPAREALFSSLAKSLILNGKMVTTKAKAKAVQGDLEKFVTLAKKGGIENRRRVLASLDNSREATDFLFQKIASIFSGKISGFTRITNLPVRRGDNAQMVKMEWTEKIVAEDKSKKDKKDESETKTVKVNKSKIVKESKMTHI